MKSRTSIIILVIFAALMVTSCRSSTRMQRQAYKVEGEIKSEDDQASEEYRKHHYELQADKTKQMMKDSKKRNKKLKKSKREPFFKRLFGGNRSKGCN